VPSQLPVTALRLVVRGVVRPLFGPRVPQPVQRRGFELLAATLPGAKVRRERGVAGGVPVLNLTPDDAEPGVMIVHFHGGGYVTGSAQGYSAMTSRLARAAKARVIGVDYRLAPEHPFPAAFDDACALYEALLADGQDPAKLTLIGDSAGGGLALACVLAARDRGLPLPGRLILFSPWLDLRVPKPRDGVDDPMLTRPSLDRWAGDYCGAHPRQDPRISPLLAEDLAGLPPTLIQFDTREMLAIQSTAFATRARAAGSEIELQPFEGLWHVFEFFTQLPQARAAITLAAQFATRSPARQTSAG
jgi:epsilon-lactone hydrolase